MYEIIEKGAELADGVQVGNYVTIKSGAKIGRGTVIGDYCHIGGDVAIGENNQIGLNVHIKGKTQIGNRNHILDNTVIGLCSKHIGYHFYEGRVLIGDDNFIGNGCAVDCGNNHLTQKGYNEYQRYLAADLPVGADLEDATIIGNRCYILNNVTIHHNCRVGLGDIADCAAAYDTVICTGCCLNGFVQVRKGAELCSGTYIREYVSLGEGVFTAMMSHIVKDVLPFEGILQNRCIAGYDKLMQKFGVSEEEVQVLRRNFQQKRSGRLKLYGEDE